MQLIAAHLSPSVQCGVMLALLSALSVGLGTTVLFCLFARPWLFLWLGQDQFSLFLCSSSPSSLLHCCEILSPSTIFAYFQDVFTLVIHSAKYFSVYIYLDAQTIQLAMGMMMANLLSPGGPFNSLPVSVCEFTLGSNLETIPAPVLSCSPCY